MKWKALSLFAATGFFFACSTPNTATTSTTATSTSTNTAYDVPASLQSSFNTRYPGASTVVWSRYDATAVPIDWELSGWDAMDANDYAVTFNMGGDNYYAWYDSEGNWIGSSYALRDMSKLPQSVNTLIQTKYSGYTIEKVDREMWKDQMAYEIKLKNGDNSKVKLLVDANGNVLKEKMK